MYNIELLISVVLLVTAYNTDSSMEKESRSINTSADIAFKSINQAQLAGADVSDLVKRFNTALDLIDQAEESRFDSCSSYKDCTDRSLTMFVEITNDAHFLKEQVKDLANLHNLVNLGIYAPVSAFVTSVAGYWSFKTWKSHNARRFLDMEIKVKEK